MAKKIDASNDESGKGHHLSPWCAMTRALMERTGTSNTDLAKMVGVTQPQVSFLINGQVRPPLNDMDKFCDALGLEGSERDNYVTQAYLAHAPQRVRILVEQQAAEIRRLRLAVASSSKKQG